MVHCGDNGRQRCVGRRFPALRLYFPVNEKSRGSAYNRYERIRAKLREQNKKSPPPASVGLSRIGANNRAEQEKNRPPAQPHVGSTFASRDRDGDELCPQSRPGRARAPPHAEEAHEVRRLEA
jgi:hypothetical protein